LRVISLVHAESPSEDSAGTKDEGIQELEYFEKYWAEKYGLQTAYEMYEGQFVKLEKKGIHLKPKNLLKAV
jgi:hypothetical protein